MRSPGGSSIPADDDSGSYPRWCFGAVIILTVTAFISHAAPTEWLRPSKPIQVVAAKETKISDELFAAPSALPHESVMKEVFDTLHTGDTACMKAPKSWGKVPTRVDIPEAFETDPPVLVYQDVLVARDPVCARLTRAKHKGKSGGVEDQVHESPDGRKDEDRVVWTTHMNRGRMPRLLDLVKRWGGCISVALWVCKVEDWEYVLKLHTEDKGLGDLVTFHGVIGHGAYPYNLQRNVALAPFAPWAVGNGRPAPWVVVADADGVPSVGEEMMSKYVVAGAAGTLTEPEVLTGSVPEELKWMGTGPMSLGPPHVDPEKFVYDKPPKDVCDAWDGKPEPMQCEVVGRPSGLGWGRSWVTASWAATRSRCGKPVNPQKSFFVIPSFDSLRDNGEQVARLRAIPPNAHPSVAWAYLRKLWDHGGIEIQAATDYAPSYESMVPWKAWRDNHPAGLMAVHYGFIYEPYIVTKAPFPSSSIDKWEPFDEYFREPGFDKCIFFTETAGLRSDDPNKYYLHVLPQIFLLNDDSGSSGGPRPSRHMNWERFMASPREHGVWCQDLCPCVAWENRSVAPPQGFWDNSRPQRRRSRALQGKGGEVVGYEGGGVEVEEQGGEEVEMEEKVFSPQAHVEYANKRAII